MSEIKNNNSLAVTLREFLIGLPRPIKQLIAFGTDAIGFAICVVGVAWLLFADDLSVNQIARIGLATSVAGLLLAWSQGLYRSVVRYMGLDLFVSGMKTAAGAALVGGAEENSIQLRNALESRGVFGSPFCDPATPKNRSLIRFTVNAGHRLEQLEQVVAVCEEIRGEVRMEAWPQTRKRGFGMN